MDWLGVERMVRLLPYQLVGLAPFGALLVLARAMGNRLVVEDCETALRDLSGVDSAPTPATGVGAR